VRYEQPDADTVRYYLPRVQLFAEAVKSGKLQGELLEPLSKDSDKRSVRLKSLSGLEAFLKEHGVAACFEEDSLVLKRAKPVER
jgi:hypothetical protein